MRVSSGASITLREKVTHTLSACAIGSEAIAASRSPRSGGAKPMPPAASTPVGTVTISDARRTRRRPASPA